MNKYLFIPNYDTDDTDDISSKSVIIEANNVNHAISIYGRHYAKYDELLIDSFIDRSVNMSFYSKFWIQGENEERVYCTTGKILIDENEFKNRILEYFEGNKIWADILINYYFSESDQPPNFPEDMFLFVWIINFDRRDYIIIDLSKSKSM